MTTLFVDLDGVLADFDAAFAKTFGGNCRELADDELWAKINSHPSYFRDIEPFAGAKEFYGKIEHLEPIILTACPKSNYHHVARQKREWVREHLSSDCLILPVAGGSSKPLFMRAPGDVLIDDFERNTDLWEKAGGIPILHRDFGTTASLLSFLIAGKIFEPRAVHWKQAVQDAIGRIYNGHAASIIETRARELAAQEVA